MKTHTKGKNINNKNELLKDYELLKSVMTDAGFRKIELFYTDKNIIYVVKDDFTKHLSTNTLKEMAKNNDLPDAQYVLINKDNMKKMSRSEIKYIRFNTTKALDEYWQNLQQKLLEDKKTKFKIKRKYVL